jgi:hypothetical protein
MDLSLQDLGWILAASVGVVVGWALLQAAWYHRATLGETMTRAIAVLLPGTVTVGRHVRGRVMARWQMAFDDDTTSDYDDDAPHNNNHNNGTTPIATPQPPHNALLQHNEDAALVAKAEAVVAMVDGGLKMPDGSNATETKAIKLLFGVSPGSSNPRYQAAVAAVRAVRARQQHVTPIVGRPTSARFSE